MRPGGWIAGMLGLSLAAAAPAAPPGPAPEPRAAQGQPAGCKDIIGGTGGAHLIRTHCPGPAIVPPAPVPRSSGRWLLLSQDAATRLWLDGDGGGPGQAPRIWLRLEYREPRDGVKLVDHLEQFDCGTLTGDPLLRYDYGADGSATAGEADSDDLWMSLILPEYRAAVGAAVCRAGG